MMTTLTTQTSELPLACNLGAFDATQRARHRELLGRVINERLELRELPDGYAFAFPAETQTVMMLTEYVTLERVCCPFLTLVLRFEANQDSLWLEVTGAEDAKPLIAQSFEAALT
jgi:hypothetical protein